MATDMDVLGGKLLDEKVEQAQEDQAIESLLESFALD